mmetsp:Transcript_65058/g.156968  ORF Transcript_65058/g.156968 Transcript_65058/m.156968 type:complete len:227 (+) Transcript_65058:281-961(+)
MAAPSPYASTCSSLSARCLERAPTVTLATFTRSFERCHALLLGIGRSMQANSLLADARVRPACAAPRFARAWIDACFAPRSELGSRLVVSTSLVMRWQCLHHRRTRLRIPVIFSSTPLTLSFPKRLQCVHRMCDTIPNCTLPIPHTRLPTPTPLTDGAYRMNLWSADWTSSKRASFTNHSGSSVDGRSDFLRAADRQLAAVTSAARLLRRGAGTRFLSAMPCCLQP